MILEVFYTDESEETLQLVYDFIENKFGKKLAEQFSLKAGKIIELIRHYPFMYKATSFDESIRVALITKQTSLFYRVTDTSVQLLFFWDNRQEPFLI